MNVERQKQLSQALENILQTLTTNYQPQKVILFGSMAHGSVSAWSDLDLVIIKDTSLPFRKRLTEVALLCRARVGVDFLVYTPGEFAQMVTDKNPFILEEIIRKGKVLYKREPVRPAEKISTFIRKQITQAE